MANEPSSQPNEGPRLRQRPQERFAPPTELFDLSAAAQELANEGAPTVQGHRQKMLYRHGSTSVSLFLFEAGAGLREHQTNGTVFIQALDGRLTIHAGAEEHDLAAGRLLVMSPRVPHDVTAVVPSRMLLTVSLETSA